MMPWELLRDRGGLLDGLQAEGLGLTIFLTGALEATLEQLATTFYL
jgi:hypothetical protein